MVVRVTKHKFLSDSWITEAQKIAAEYADDLPAPEVQTVINVIVNNIEHREDQTLLGHLDTNTAEPVVEVGHSTDAETTVTISYETAKLVFLTPDPTQLMQEFMAGKILVEGDATKLLALQNNPGAQPDPDIMALYKEIQEMTEG